MTHKNDCSQIVLRRSPIFSGIRKVDSADLVGSAKRLVSEIVTALDDIAGTSAEQGEGLANWSDKAAIHSGTAFGSNFAWGMAEHFFQYLTSCSAVQEEIEDRSRLIREEVKLLPARSTSVVQEFKTPNVRPRYPLLSDVTEEYEEYEGSATDKSRDNSKSQLKSISHG